MDKEQLKHVWLAVIAGGKGTRLFPISNEGCPKQFCDLNKSETFIQATIKRFLKLGVSATRVVIITTNPNQTELAVQQTQGLGILSQNICEVEDSWGYPGVMVKSTEIIAGIDPEAIIINTPSDQYIVEGEEFEQAIEGSLSIAAEGKLAVVGVRITDLVTATGCGHVVYDASEDADDFGFRKMADFVEKPAKELADSLMRSEGSSCNTGINVWRVDTVLNKITPAMIVERKKEASDSDQKWELRTDGFLKMFSEVRAVAGAFRWYDCGTLQALYEISPKTPNHKNASIGGGVVDRTDCMGNLFYAAEGFRLHVTGFKDCVGAVNIVQVNGVWLPISCIVKRSDSQRVKELAENILASKQILSTDFQINARNNIVMRSNISNEMVFGFVGVENCIVNAYKNTDGTYDVYMAQQGSVNISMA